MTRVDFYILENGDLAASEAFACRVIEKAFRNGHGVFVHTASPVDSQRLDDLLWTFRPGSFVPHHRTEQAVAPNAAKSPVVISHKFDLATNADMLVNLSGCVPDQLDSFQRIAEVIADDENAKLSARQRFRLYRELGSELHSHSMTA
jgi:DNA polymerase-3 subunit chi